MSFAYFPLYTGDYLRDTRHLGPLRHGVYLLALMHCWDSKGPMPLDEQECAGICNCRSSDEVEALRYVLGRFFVRMDDGHYNKRMAEEVARAELTSLGRREGGLKSAQARRQKARAGVATKREQELNKSSTQVELKSVSPSPSPSPYSIQEIGPSVSAGASVAKAPAKPRKTGTRLPEEWQLPLAWGQWALKEYPHWTPEVVRKIGQRFRDHWTAKAGKDATKLDWLATWRNWCASGITQKENPPPTGRESGETAYQRGKRERVSELTGGLAARAAPGQQVTIDIEAIERTK